MNNLDIVLALFITLNRVSIGHVCNLFRSSHHSLRAHFFLTRNFMSSCEPLRHWAILYYWRRCSYLSSVKQVKPKTWRIFTFADARMTPLVPNPRGNYHWARLILSPLPLSHPPDFRKNILAFCFEVCLGVCLLFELHKWQESSWLVKDRERIFKPQEILERRYLERYFKILFICSIY